MKKITYAGATIITGNLVAAALVEYLTQLPNDAVMVSVDIPVQESNGTITTHTILLGPGTQFDIADIDGRTKEQEDALFAAPVFPPPVAIVPAVATASTEASAKEFNEAVAHVDEGLDRG